MNAADPPRAIELRVTGLVQGVGFRPFVWRLAHERGLTGRVRNDGVGVLIEVSGPGAALADFKHRLRAEAPPLARIHGMEAADIADDRDWPTGFLIDQSVGGAVRTGALPDAATCPDCLAEMREPGERRHGYAFTNCTHCGPRFTIIRSIPYDRANTTMAAFALCPDCRTEYEDPADRRFHAQPNACPVCGPRIWLEDAAGTEITEAVVDHAVALLRGGGILAVKGLGGFHLACDARTEDTVAALRRRKNREAKPFGLMVADLDQARALCHVDPAEADALAGPAAPLVLMEARLPTPVAPSVAPGQGELAVMLPYSPLHHLLLAAHGGPLVMTSANASGAPQVIDNDEARRDLSGIADGFLMHDRPIAQRVDDSVLRHQAGRPRLLRRARGFAPAPLVLHDGFAQMPAVLAMGADLKSTFCLMRDGRATPSQHLGDLGDARTAAEYGRALALYRDLLDFTPAAVAVDLHPAYHARRVGQQLAADLELPLVPVQHHHAHLASVLAEHRLPPDTPPVLGVILDGIGAGEDGNGWGCELLLGNFTGYQRLASLRAAPLPGGERAMVEPWRNLLAQVETGFGWEAARDRWPHLAEMEAWRDRDPQTLLAALRRGINAPMASSAGRLFDAVAAALDLHPHRLSFEGQAAMALEGLARQSPAEDACAYPFGQMANGEVVRLDPAPMWTALLDDLASGVARGRIAMRFHRGLAGAVVSQALDQARRTAVDTVALSGGVFQNRTLAALIREGFAGQNLTILENAELPANDGGVSLGQAAVCAAWLAC